MNLIRLAEINQTISAIDSFVITLKIRRKEVMEIIENCCENIEARKLLMDINDELVKYRKLRRRAKCRLYDFNYYHTERGRANRIKRSRQQSKEKQEMAIQIN